MKESNEEEREDRTLPRLTLENCSGDGSKERTVEGSVEGERDFRLRRVVTV